jgi:hypothetical protein
MRTIDWRTLSGERRLCWQVEVLQCLFERSMRKLGVTVWTAQRPAIKKLRLLITLAFGASLTHTLKTSASWFLSLIFFWLLRHHAGVPLAKKIQKDGPRCVMFGNKERWHELCEQASTEQDPNKLLDLYFSLDLLLCSI